jgi:DNA-binding GntR family transcriptional regulator
MAVEIIFSIRFNHTAGVMVKRSNPNLSAPLSEIAYQKIKELIISIKLSPGEQIEEISLAEKLSIGRTPIREALFRLAAENLVEVVHGRGFFVRDITLRDLKDLFETMLILEKSAVALAARRIQKFQLEKLQGLNEALRSAWQKRNYLSVTYLNSQFHRMLYDAVDNTLLFSYLNNLQNQSQRLAYICFSNEVTTYDLQSHSELALRDHRDLIESLARRDGDEAVNVITRHIKLFHHRVYHYTLPNAAGADFIPSRESQDPVPVAGDRPF